MLRASIFVTTTLLSLSTQALEIYSLDLNKETTVIGQPIVVSDNGSPIYHFRQEGGINNYVWVDGSDNLIARGVYYKPLLKDKGKYIKLCLTSEKSSECSNPLLITEEPIKRASSETKSIMDFWTLEDRITNEGIIYNTDETLNISTTITYIGTPPIESLPQNTPYFNTLYYKLMSKEITLVSLTPYSLFQHDITINSQKLEESLSGLNLTSFLSIEQCSLGLASSGENPYFESPSCDMRYIKDSSTDMGEWVLPPTEREFNALFPGNDYEKEMVGDLDYVSNNRIGKDGTDLLESYCSAVSNNAVPVTSKQLVELGNSGDVTDEWPGYTNYWSNEYTEGPYQIPGITWSNTVSIAGTNTIWAADNLGYFGFMICYIPRN